jgi:hypothetical protein
MVLTQEVFSKMRLITLLFLIVRIASTTTNSISINKHILGGKAIG